MLGVSLVLMVLKIRIGGFYFDALLCLLTRDLCERIKLAISFKHNQPKNCGLGFDWSI